MVKDKGCCNDRTTPVGVSTVPYDVMAVFLHVMHSYGQALTLPLASKAVGIKDGVVVRFVCFLFLQIKMISGTN